MPKNKSNNNNRSADASAISNISDIHADSDVTDATDDQSSMLIKAELAKVKSELLSSQEQIAVCKKENESLKNYSQNIKKDRDLLYSASLRSAAMLSLDPANEAQSSSVKLTFEGENAAAKLSEHLEKSAEKMVHFCRQSQNSLERIAKLTMVESSSITVSSTTLPEDVLTSVLKLNKDYSHAQLCLDKAAEIVGSDSSAGTAVVAACESLMKKFQMALDELKSAGDFAHEAAELAENAAKEAQEEAARQIQENEDRMIQMEDELNQTINDNSNIVKDLNKLKESAKTAVLVLEKDHKSNDEDDINIKNVENTDELARSLETAAARNKDELKQLEAARAAERSQFEQEKSKLQREVDSLKKAAEKASETLSANSGGANDNNNNNNNNNKTAAEAVDALEMAATSAASRQSRQAKTLAEAADELSAESANDVPEAARKLAAANRKLWSENDDLKTQCERASEADALAQKLRDQKAEHDAEVKKVAAERDALLESSKKALTTLRPDARNDDLSADEAARRLDTAAARAFDRIGNTLAEASSLSSNEQKKKKNDNDDENINDESAARSVNKNNHDAETVADAARSLADKCRALEKRAVAADEAAAEAEQLKKELKQAKVEAETKETENAKLARDNKTLSDASRAALKELGQDRETKSADDLAMALEAAATNTADRQKQSENALQRCAAAVNESSSLPNSVASAVEQNAEKLNAAQQELEKTKDAKSNAEQLERMKEAFKRSAAALECGDSLRYEELPRECQGLMEKMKRSESELKELKEQENDFKEAKKLAEKIDSQEKQHQLELQKKQQEINTMKNSIGKFVSTLRPGLKQDDLTPQELAASLDSTGGNFLNRVNDLLQKNERVEKENENDYDDDESHEINQNINNANRKNADEICSAIELLKKQSATANEESTRAEKAEKSLAAANSENEQLHHQLRQLKDQTEKLSRDQEMLHSAAQETLKELDHDRETKSAEDTSMALQAAARNHKSQMKRLEKNFAKCENALLNDDEKENSSSSSPEVISDAVVALAAKNHKLENELLDSRGKLKDLDQLEDLKKKLKTIEKEHDEEVERNQREKNLLKECALRNANTLTSFKNNNTSMTRTMSSSDVDDDGTSSIAGSTSALVTTSKLTTPEVVESLDAATKSVLAKSKKNEKIIHQAAQELGLVDTENEADQIPDTCKRLKEQLKTSHSQIEELKKKLDDTAAMEQLKDKMQEQQEKFDKEMKKLKKENDVLMSASKRALKHLGTDQSVDQAEADDNENGNDNGLSAEEVAHEVDRGTKQFVNRLDDALKSHRVQGQEEGKKRNVDSLIEAVEHLANKCNKLESELEKKKEVENDLQKARDEIKEQNEAAHQLQRENEAVIRDNKKLAEAAKSALGHLSSGSENNNNSTDELARSLETAAARNKDELKQLEAARAAERSQIEQEKSKLQRDVDSLKRAAEKASETLSSNSGGSGNNNNNKTAAEAVDALEMAATSAASRQSRQAKTLAEAAEELNAESANDVPEAARKLAAANRKLQSENDDLKAQCERASEADALAQKLRDQKAEHDAEVKKVAAERDALLESSKKALATLRPDARNDDLSADEAARRLDTAAARAFDRIGNTLAEASSLSSNEQKKQKTNKKKNDNDDENINDESAAPSDNKNNHNAETVADAARSLADKCRALEKRAVAADEAAAEAEQLKKELKQSKAETETKETENAKLARDNKTLADASRAALKELGQDRETKSADDLAMALEAAATNQKEKLSRCQQGLSKTAVALGEDAQSSPEAIAQATLSLSNQLAKLQSKVNEASELADQNEEASRRIKALTAERDELAADLRRLEADFNAVADHSYQCAQKLGVDRMMPNSSTMMSNSIFDQSNINNNNFNDRSASAPVIVPPSDDDTASQQQDNTNDDNTNDVLGEENLTNNELTTPDQSHLIPSSSAAEQQEQQQPKQNTQSSASTQASPARATSMSSSRYLHGGNNSRRHFSGGATSTRSMSTPSMLFSRRPLQQSQQMSSIMRQQQRGSFMASLPPPQSTAEIISSLDMGVAESLSTLAQANRARDRCIEALPRVLLVPPTPVEEAEEQDEDVFTEVEDSKSTAASASSSTAMNQNNNKRRKRSNSVKSTTSNSNMNQHHQDASLLVSSISPWEELVDTCHRAAHKISDLELENEKLKEKAQLAAKVPELEDALSLLQKRSTETIHGLEKDRNLLCESAKRVISELRPERGNSEQVEELAQHPEEVAPALEAAAHSSLDKLYRLSDAFERIAKLMTTAREGNDDEEGDEAVDDEENNKNDNDSNSEDQPQSQQQQHHHHAGGVEAIVDSIEYLLGEYQSLKAEFDELKKQQQDTTVATNLQNEIDRLHRELDRLNKQHDQESQKQLATIKKIMKQVPVDDSEPQENEVFDSVSDALSALDSAAREQHSWNSRQSSALKRIQGAVTEAKNNSNKETKSSSSSSPESTAAETETALSRLLQELSRTNDQLQNLQEQRDKLSAQLQEKEDDLHRLNDDLSRSKNEISKLENNLKDAENTLAREKQLREQEQKEREKEREISGKELAQTQQELEQQHLKLQQLQQEQQQKQNEEEETVRVIREDSSSNKKNALKIDELANLLEEEMQKSADLKKEVDDLQRQNKLLQREGNDLKEDNKQLEQSLSEKEDKNRQLVKDLNAQKLKSEKENAALNELVEEVKDHNKQLQSRINSLEDDLVNLKNDDESTKTQIENQQQQFEKSKKEIAALKNQLSDMKNDLEKSADENSDLKKEIEKQSVQNTSLQQEIKNQQQELSQNEDQFNSLRRLLAKTTNNGFNLAATTLQFSSDCLDEMSSRLSDEVNAVHHQNKDLFAKNIKTRDAALSEKKILIEACQNVVEKLLMTDDDRGENTANSSSSPSDNTSDISYETARATAAALSKIKNQEEKLKRLNQLLVREANHGHQDSSTSNDSELLLQKLIDELNDHRRETSSTKTLQDQNHELHQQFTKLVDGARRAISMLHQFSSSSSSPEVDYSNASNISSHLINSASNASERARALQELVDRSCGTLLEVVAPPPTSSATSKSDENDVNDTDNDHTNDLDDIHLRQIAAAAANEIRELRSAVRAAELNARSKGIRAADDVTTLMMSMLGTISNIDNATNNRRQSLLSVEVDKRRRAMFDQDVRSSGDMVVGASTTTAGPTPSNNNMDPSTTSALNDPHREENDEAALLALISPHEAAKELSDASRIVIEQCRFLTKEVYQYKNRAQHLAKTNEETLEILYPAVGDEHKNDDQENNIQNQMMGSSPSPSSHGHPLDTSLSSIVHNTTNNNPNSNSTHTNNFVFLPNLAKSAVEELDVLRSRAVEVAKEKQLLRRAVQDRQVLLDAIQESCSFYQEKQQQSSQQSPLEDGESFINNRNDTDNSNNVVEISSRQVPGAARQIRTAFDDLKKQLSEKDRQFKDSSISSSNKINRLEKELLDLKESSRKLVEVAMSSTKATTATSNNNEDDNSSKTLFLIEQMGEATHQLQTSRIARDKNVRELLRTCGASTTTSTSSSDQQQQQQQITYYDIVDTSIVYSCTEYVNALKHEKEILHIHSETFEAKAFTTTSMLLGNAQLETRYWFNVVSNTIPSLYRKLRDCHLQQQQSLNSAGSNTSNNGSFSSSSVGGDLQPQNYTNNNNNNFQLDELCDALTAELSHLRRHCAELEESNNASSQDQSTLFDAIKKAVTSMKNSLVTADENNINNNSSSPRSRSGALAAEDTSSNLTENDDEAATMSIKAKKHKETVLLAQQLAELVKLITDQLTTAQQDIEGAVGITEACVGPTYLPSKNITEDTKQKATECCAALGEDLTDFKKIKKTICRYLDIKSIQDVEKWDDLVVAFHQKNQESKNRLIEASKVPPSLENSFLSLSGRLPSNPLLQHASAGNGNNNENTAEVAAHPHLDTEWVDQIINRLRSLESLCENQNREIENLLNARDAASIARETAMAIQKSPMVSDLDLPSALSSPSKHRATSRSHENNNNNRLDDNASNNASPPDENTSRQHQYQHQQQQRTPQHHPHAPPNLVLSPKIMPQPQLHEDSSSSPSSAAAAASKPPPKFSLSQQRARRGSRAKPAQLNIGSTPGVNVPLGDSLAASFPQSILKKSSSPSGANRDNLNQNEVANVSFSEADETKQHVEDLQKQCDALSGHIGVLNTNIDDLRLMIEETRNVIVNESGVQAVKDQAAKDDAFAKNNNSSSGGFFDDTPSQNEPMKNSGLVRLVIRELNDARNKISELERNTTKSAEFENLKLNFDKQTDDMNKLRQNLGESQENLRKSKHEIETFKQQARDAASQQKCNEFALHLYEIADVLDYRLPWKKPRDPTQLDEEELLKNPMNFGTATAISSSNNPLSSISSINSSTAGDVDTNNNNKENKNSDLRSPTSSAIDNWTPERVSAASLLIRDAARDQMAKNKQLAVLEETKTMTESIRSAMMEVCVLCGLDPLSRNSPGMAVEAVRLTKTNLLHSIQVLAAYSSSSSRFANPDLQTKFQLAELTGAARRMLELCTTKSSMTLEAVNELARLCSIPHPPLKHDFETQALRKMKDAVAAVITKVCPAGANATLFKTSLISTVKRNITPDVERTLQLPQVQQQQQQQLESLSDTYLLAYINTILSHLVKNATGNSDAEQQLAALKQKWRQEREETARRIGPLIQIVRTKLNADQKSSDALREVDRFLMKIQTLSDQQQQNVDQLNQINYNNHLQQVSRMVTHMRQMVQSKIAQDAETEKTVISICSPPKNTSIENDSQRHQLSLQHRHHQHSSSSSTDRPPAELASAETVLANVERDLVHRQHQQPQQYQQPQQQQYGHVIRQPGMLRRSYSASSQQQQHLQPSPVRGTAAGGFCATTSIVLPTTPTTSSASALNNTSSSASSTSNYYQRQRI